MAVMLLLVLFTIAAALYRCWHISSALGTTWISWHWTIPRTISQRPFSLKMRIKTPQSSLTLLLMLTRLHQFMLLCLMGWHINWDQLARLPCLNGLLRLGLLLWPQLAAGGLHTGIRRLQTAQPDRRFVLEELLYPFQKLGLLSGVRPPIFAIVIRPCSQSFPLRALLFVLYHQFVNFMVDIKHFLYIRLDLGSRGM